MSEKTVNDVLFDEAKAAAGRLCFDISTDKATCVRQALVLTVEIGKMIIALDPKKEAASITGKVVGK